MTNLGKTTGANLPGRGLINPAFVIKIVPATDILQQQPSTGRDNPKDDYLDNLDIGSEVVAKIGKEEISGTVQRIVKNELGDGIFAIIIDSNGKVHKIEGSRIKKVSASSSNNDKARLVSSPAIFNETRFLSFDGFLKS